ncbi:MAG: hypothetical protein WC879_13805 [Melioribacteraceae bacterium]
MFNLILIVFGFLLIVFHQQLANYYRSFGRDKNPPVKWKYAEEVTFIAGLILILKGLITFFNK